MSEEWYESRSYIRPSEIDSTSSSYYVYERKDIRKEQDEQSEDMIYVYQERKIDKSKWLSQATATNKENIDAIMAGLADLYELQLETLGV